MNDKSDKNKSDKNKKPRVFGDVNFGVDYSVDKYGFSLSPYEKEKQKLTNLREILQEKHDRAFKLKLEIKQLRSQIHVLETTLLGMDLKQRPVKSLAELNADGPCPVLTHENIRQGFQYTLDPYQKAVLEAWSHQKITPTVTIEEASFIRIGDGIRCVSFVVRSNALRRKSVTIMVEFAVMFFRTADRLRIAIKTPPTKERESDSIFVHLNSARDGVEILVTAEQKRKAQKRKEKQEKKKKNSKSSRRQSLAQKYAHIKAPKK